MLSATIFVPLFSALQIVSVNESVLRNAHIRFGLALGPAVHAAAVAGH
jgi:hypothetical protein